MDSSYQISPDDTATTALLKARLEATIARVHPGEDAGFVGVLLARVEGLFRGADGAFEPIDMAYHNLDHTWQTALCLARMYEGACRADASRLVIGDFRRALAAMVYHDTGYLKSRGDRQGTGAKFTFVHERRSAELAVRDLSGMGWSGDEVESVAQFIRCTGPSSRPDRLVFRDTTDAMLGAMVCTADFLGQMSDPGYLRKLPALYAEFLEAYRSQGIPPEARPFASFADLWRKTPAFWANFVMPKLRRECAAVYRHLETGAGRNPYLEAVAAHMAVVVATDPPAFVE